jgi:hypothetical protein
VIDAKTESPLESLLKIKVDSMSQLSFVVEKLEADVKRPYKSFFPLMRVKGHFLKMGRMKLSHYQRYIYLNPIEGVLISYKNTNKFPHAPNYIINLLDIVILEFMKESRWFFKPGYYYMHIQTKDKEVVFYDNNLDMVNFAINQIDQARRFYSWLQDIIRVRYDNVPDTETGKKADQLINRLLQLSIPEIDKDLYSHKMTISVAEYANKQATTFLNQMAPTVGPTSAHSQMTSSSSNTAHVMSNNKASLDAVTSNEPLPNSQSNSLDNSGVAETKSNPQLAKTSEVTDPETTSPQPSPKAAEKVVFKEPSDQEKLLDDGENGI